MRVRRGPVRRVGGHASVEGKIERRTVESGASATGKQNLINNRQGGRRRGRGGQRPQGMPSNAGGNRQDNRQRGNAAQLLEKYKSLARDAQLAGDRVQTEYYLQYADHYFRVLEDSRSRFEEQQAQRRPRRDDEEDGVEGDEELVAEHESTDDDGEDFRQRPRTRDRERGRERFERADRGDRDARANGARRDEREDDTDDGEERIALGVLPPSIGATDVEAEEEAPKPRRRARKPRPEDDGDEIAPAA